MRYRVVMIGLTVGMSLFAANFYRDNNGVTIRCENAAVGESGMVDGVVYTKIDSKDDLVIHHGEVNASQACTSGVTSMSGWFQDKDTFEGSIAHWDTSSVTDMCHMFAGATVFNQPI